MEVNRWHLAQFWDPLVDKIPMGIMVLALLNRIINTNGIDACGARLHLALTPVNTRFVVNKKPGQMQTGFTPRQPKVIAGHSHQHCPHAKINPTGGN